MAKEIEKDEYEDVSLEERVVSMEKKINWILGLLVLITIFSLLIMVFVLQDGNTSTRKGENTTSETEETQSYSANYDVSAFKEIKAQDIAKESKNKTIMVYVGRETCGYCIQFVPILTSVQKSLGGYTTYYIDIAKIIDYSSGSIKDNEANDIMQNLKTVSAQKGVMDDWGATPMTLVIKNSQIVDSLIGYTEESTVTQFVKDNKLAK